MYFLHLLLRCANFSFFMYNFKFQGTLFCWASRLAKYTISTTSLRTTQKFKTFLVWSCGYKDAFFCSNFYHSRLRQKQINIYKVSCFVAQSLVVRSLAKVKPFRPEGFWFHPNQRPTVLDICACYRLVINKLTKILKSLIAAKQV